jgi:Protein of unknown function (DUF2934)
MTSIARRKQRELTDPALSPPLAPVVLDGSEKQSPSPSISAAPPPEEIDRLIRETAYFKAEARGFAPGEEVQDWLSAEREVCRALKIS